ncbi:MAG: protein kinase [Deltaproteobacteria bacterium]|nr:protein kinase [Deltaproteobacteria bacterium]
MPRLDLISARDLPVTVERYTLTGLLGEGGMARVFRAQMEGALGFKKPAAVKVVLPAQGERGESLRQQLIQEARLGGLLNHPNVVQTFDCGELEGFPYIAMELVEGAGLDDLVDEVGPLQPAVLLDISIQIAKGLHHAHVAHHDGHSLHIIHRDVKPSNVLIREDGVVKVMDFGIAKVALHDALSTATGMTKGTPSYMSPEQLAAEPLDARTDLFALGALMHYMRTGRTLFVGGSLTEVMLRIIQVDETVKNQQILEQTDAYLPGLGAVLARLLVKERDERYASAAELAHELAVLRKRLHEPSTLLATMVRESFGAKLADARSKASSISGPSPFRKEKAAAAAAPEPEPEPEPGPTRSFPPPAGVSAQGDISAVPEPVVPVGATVAMLQASDGEWSRAEESAKEPAPAGLQTRPDMPGRGPAARTKHGPVPGEPKTVPPPRKRRKRRGAKGRKKRQGALFALGIVAGGLIAVLVVGLLLRGSGDEPPPIAPDPTPAPVAEKPTPKPEPEPATPKPRVKPKPAVRTPPPVVRADPTPVPPKKVDPIPSPPVRSAPEPTPAVAEATPSPKERPTPGKVKGADPAPEPAAKVPADQRLSAEHVAIRRAAVGTTKSVVVRVEGPSNTVVTLYYGPPGGPHQSTRLSLQGDDVFKGSIIIGEALGGGFEYWVVVKNKRTTPRVVALGRQSAPYKVNVY